MMQSPLAPFDLSARAKPVDRSAGVWANEIGLLGYISLRGNSADAPFMAAASRALGVTLPGEPCTYAEKGLLKVLWLSPDEWLIVCARADRAHILGALSATLKGIRSQVVDNSGGYTQILLEGANAADVLSHATVYDLAALTAGRVVGSTFGKSSLFMHRLGDGGFCLVLRRSFADYIWRYLERAAKPYGFAVARLEQDSPS
jgi:sarcosine oxidase subunit gamma